MSDAQTTGLAARLLGGLVDRPLRLAQRSFEAVWQPTTRVWRAGEAYRHGIDEVGSAPAVVVWRRGRVRLLRYTPTTAQQYATPLLIIPSLINRYYILDLLPERSMVRALVAHGFDVFLLDWGTPGPADFPITLDDHITQYVGQALRATLRMAAAPQATLLGYCMGGTFATIFTALEPAPVANLVNLAGPISFDDDGIFALLTRSDWFNADALVAGYGNVPAGLLLLTFNMIRPTSHLLRGVYMLEKLDSADAVRSFAAMQKWIFDQVDFPGLAFYKYVSALYQRNELVQGKLRVGGRAVDLSAIDVPLLTITSQQDETAPWRSVAVLNDYVASRDKRLLLLRGPHIGMVAGGSAPKHFWPQLVAWLAERSGTLRVAHGGIDGVA